MDIFATLPDGILTLAGNRMTYFYNDGGVENWTLPAGADAEKAFFFSFERWAE